MAYAAQAAGASTPKLLGTSEIGTEAALLAYEHVESRPIEDLPDEELGDELLAEMWEQVRLLHARRLAHRHLTGSRSTCRPTAASCSSTPDRARSPPVTCCCASTSRQLLAYLGLRVGPERAVKTGAAVLGADTIASALPLLQRIALGRETRTGRAQGQEPCCPPCASRSSR